MGRAKIRFLLLLSKIIIIITPHWNRQNAITKYGEIHEEGLDKVKGGKEERGTSPRKLRPTEFLELLAFTVFKQKCSALYQTIERKQMGRGEGEGMD